MNRPAPFDATDPFGSRPDEKPPEGWDARFWDGVRKEIEVRKNDPEAGRLPDPPPRRTRRASYAAVCLLLAAAVTFAARMPRARPTSSSEIAPTVVLVECSETPAVDVEWARRDGRRADYVVLRSLAPEISYVVVAPASVEP